MIKGVKKSLELPTREEVKPIFERRPYVTPYNFEGLHDGDDEIADLEDEGAQIPEELLEGKKVEPNVVKVERCPVECLSPPKTKEELYQGIYEKEESIEIRFFFTEDTNPVVSKGSFKRSVLSLRNGLLSLLEEKKSLLRPEELLTFILKRHSRETFGNDVWVLGTEFFLIGKRDLRRLKIRSEVESFRRLGRKEFPYEDIWEELENFFEEVSSFVVERLLSQAKTFGNIEFEEFFAWWKDVKDGRCPEAITEKGYRKFTKVSLALCEVYEIDSSYREVFLEGLSWKVETAWNRFIWGSFKDAYDSYARNHEREESPKEEFVIEGPEAFLKEVFLEVFERGFLKKRQKEEQKTNTKIEETEKLKVLVSEAERYGSTKEKSGIAWT